MRILILEDRDSVAYYIKQTLTSSNYITFVTLGINEANDILKSERIDCIIADLNMSPEGL